MSNMKKLTNKWKKNIIVDIMDLFAYDDCMVFNCLTSCLID